MVSVVTAVVIAVVAVRAGYVFGRLMALFLIAANVMTIRQSREVKQLDVSQQVSRLLWAGRVDDARHLAGERSEELDQRMLDVLAVVGPVGERDGDAGRFGDEDGEAMARLRSAAQHPTDPIGSTLLLLADRARRDWSSVAERPCRSAPALGSAAVVAVQNAAHAEGGDRPSAEIGQAYLDRAGPSEFDGPGHPAHIAYNTACGWAAVGEPRARPGGLPARGGARLRRPDHRRQRPRDGPAASAPGLRRGPRHHPATGARPGRHPAVRPLTRTGAVAADLRCVPSGSASLRPERGSVSHRSGRGAPRRSSRVQPLRHGAGRCLGRGRDGRRHRKVASVARTAGRVVLCAQ